MAILNNAVVNGSIRCLNKIYSKDLELTGSMSVPSLTVSGTSTLSGAVTMGSTLTVPGAVVFSKVQSVSGTQFNSPALTVGGTSAQKHLEFAYDEIQAKSNATSTGSLYLNYRGGSVYLSGDHTIYASASTFYSPDIQSTGTITAGKLTADNAVILDTLRATKYSIDSISAVGGSLYVSPTIICSNSATVKIESIDGTTVTGFITDSSSINSDSIGGVQWTQYSKIKVSGRLGNVVLSESGGTISGYLTQKLNTTSGRLNFNLTFSDANLLTVQTYSAANVHDLRVMIYERGYDDKNKNATYPVGILLTGYGYNSNSARDNSSYIDIYQGEASRTRPRIRLGKLDGIDPAVFQTAPESVSDPSKPQGWGLFADNVFLRGIIYARAGTIGGWTLDTDRFYYTANNPASNSIVLAPGGTGNVSTVIGGSSGSNNWAFTVKNVFGVTTGGALYSTSGKIGGWNIGATSIYKTIDGQYRVYLYAPGTITGTTGAIGVETINSSGTSTSQVFQVKYDGSIFATKGTIAGWNITTDRFSKATSITSGTANQTQYEMLFDAPTSIIPASTYAFLLRQRSYDGSNYGNWTRVTSLYYNGQFYSKDAIIEGSITAKGGLIAGFHITGSTDNSAKTSAEGGYAYTNSLYRHSGDGTSYEYEIGLKGSSTENPSSANTTTGNLAFYITRIAKGNTWAPGNRTNMFYVTHGGYLYARGGGRISGWSFSSTQMYKLTAITSGTASTQYGIMFNLPDSIGSTTDLFWAGSRPYDGGNKSYNGSDYGDWTKNTSLCADGTFKTTKGEIASWTLNESAIYRGSSTWGTSGTNNMYLGTSGISISNTFKVSNAGKLTATEVDISGKITATSGTIGNFHIVYNDTTNQSKNSANGGHYYPTSLYTHATAGDYDYEAGIRSSSAANNPTGVDQNTIFYVRKQPKDQIWSTTSNASFVFYVLQDGTLRSTKGYIGGFNISENYITSNASKTTYNDTTNNGVFMGTTGIGLGKGKFTVTSAGVLTATEADIKGIIKATSGTIGVNATNKITISSNTTNAAIYSGVTSIGDTAHDGFYLGTNGIVLGKGIFKVDNYGNLNVGPNKLTWDGSELIVQGTIKTTFGKIGGWDITAQSIRRRIDKQYEVFLWAPTGTPATTDYAFGIGVLNTSNAITSYPFGVKYDGSINATKGTIAGWNISSTTLYKIISGYKPYLYAPGSPGTGTSFIGLATLDANNNETGYPFRVNYDGTLTATKANITGNINANTGYIGTSTQGFEITNTSIKSRSGDTAGIIISGIDIDTTIAGDMNNSYRLIVNNNFGVTKTGNLHATGATITGTIKATSGIIGQNAANKITISSDTVNASIYSGVTSIGDTAHDGFYLGTNGIVLGKGIFKVDNYGNLNVGPNKLTWDGSELIVQGTIKTTKATIGGFTVDGTGFTIGKRTENTSGNVALQSGDFHRYINGTDRTGLRFAIGNNFAVSNTGVVYASNAIISGNITATAGKIGGWTISGNQLNSQAKSACISFGNGDCKINPVTEGSGATAVKIGYGVELAADSSDALTDGTHQIRFTGLQSITSGSYIRKDSNNSIGYSSSSSKRYKDLNRVLQKEDIELAYNIEVWLAKYKEGHLASTDERCGKQYPMFIAEQVEENIPILIDHNEKGQAENWNDRIMIPIMFQMIKSQKEEIEQLKSLIKGQNNVNS